MTSEDSEKEETKKLLEKFSKALENIKSKEDSNVERKNDRRKEGIGREKDIEFKNLILKNAPNKNEDFILAERKTW